MMLFLAIALALVCSVGLFTVGFILGTHAASANQPSILGYQLMGSGGAWRVDKVDHERELLRVVPTAEHPWSSDAS